MAETNPLWNGSTNPYVKPHQKVLAPTFLGWEPKCSTGGCKCSSGENKTVPLANANVRRARTNVPRARPPAVARSFRRSPHRPACCTDIIFFLMSMGSSRIPGLCLARWDGKKTRARNELLAPRAPSPKRLLPYLLSFRPWHLYGTCAGSLSGFLPRMGSFHEKLRFLCGSSF